MRLWLAGPACLDTTFSIWPRDEDRHKGVGEQKDEDEDEDVPQLLSYRSYKSPHEKSFTSHFFSSIKQYLNKSEKQQHSITALTSSKKKKKKVLGVPWKNNVTNVKINL